LKPSVYANLLGEKLRRHEARVWLVNTGWTGGPFGIGKRVHLPHTRTMVSAALSGALDKVTMHPHPLFGVLVPTACPDVPSEILDPMRTWARAADYEAKARDLAVRFEKNFQNFGDATAEVREAGPRLEVKV